jgi:hypothetical protein
MQVTAVIACRNALLKLRHGDIAWSRKWHLARQLSLAITAASDHCLHALLNHKLFPGCTCTPLQHCKLSTHD